MKKRAIVIQSFHLDSYLVTRSEVDGEEVPEEESRHVVQDQAIQRQIERRNSRLFLLERRPMKGFERLVDFLWPVTLSHQRVFNKLIMIHLICLHRHFKIPLLIKIKLHLQCVQQIIHHYLIIIIFLI